MASSKALALGISMLLSTFTGWRGVSKEALPFWELKFQSVSDEDFIKAVSTVCMLSQMPSNFIRTIWDVLNEGNTTQAYRKCIDLVAKYYHPDFHQSSLSVLLDKASPVLGECIMALGVGNWYYGNVEYSAFVPIYDDAIRRVDECGADRLKRLNTLTNLLTTGPADDSYRLPAGKEQQGLPPPEEPKPKPPPETTKTRSKEENQQLAQRLYNLMKAALEQPPTKEGNKNG